MAELKNPISKLQAGVPISDAKGSPKPAFQRNINWIIDSLKTLLNAANGAQTTADAAVPGARRINTTAPIHGGGDLTQDRTLSHDASGVVAGTYGDATHTLTATVDGLGHVTSLSTNAISAGAGTVTTTGSPASGNLAKFSGATSIVNGDLSGDVTTSGTLATTLATSGVSAATYGDSTHVAQIAVDAKGRITSASNVAISGAGGGSSNSYFYPAVTYTGNDTGSFATLSNAFIPGVSFTVDKLIGSFDAANIGDVYSMFIATVNSSGVISGTVATASSRFTTTATGKQTHSFSLSSAASLTAGTIYIIALVITGGSGTTPCRALTTATTLPYDFPMMDQGAAIATLSVVKRFWYTQNSDAPSSGTPVSSATTANYGLGVRAQV